MAGLAAACGAFSDASDAPVAGEGGLVAESGSSGEGGAAMDAAPEPDASHVDAAAEASAPIGRKCAVGTGFQTLTSIPISGGQSIESVRVSADQSTGYFSVCPPAAITNCSLFSAAKSGTAFTGFMSMLTGTATTYDAFATVSSDGAQLVFDSNRDPSGHTRLFSGTLVDDKVTVAGVSVLPFPATIASPFAASHPYLLTNGVLYFAARGTADFDLYRATGPSSSEVAAAARLDVSDAVQLDFAPVVSEDELEVFWATNRTPPLGSAAGGLDVWTASRTPMAPNGAFANPEFSAKLSSSMEDHPVWLSPDACDLYLVRKATGTSPGTLAVAHR